MKRCCLLLVLSSRMFTAEAQNETSIHEEAGTQPVMFDSVRAVVRHDLIQIGWSNLTEREVEFYMIERSENGIDFIAIHQQTPFSNLNEKASYNYTDAKAIDGANFYRIRARIVTGRTVSSRILKAEMGVRNPGFTLYPNPVKGDECTISLAAVRKGIYKLTVVNNAGQLIHQMELNSQGDVITQDLDLPHGLMAGVYVVDVRGEHYHSSQLFIKK